MNDFFSTILVIALATAIGYALYVFHAYMRQFKLGFVGLGIFYTANFFLSVFNPLSAFIILLGYLYLLYWFMIDEWLIEKVFKGSSWHMVCWVLLIPLGIGSWVHYATFMMDKI